MATMRTETATNEQALDRAIERIENLYRTVTGRDVPPTSEQGSGGIPPERNPGQHVGEQIDRLIEALGRIGSPRTAAWMPAVAVWEGEEELRIQVDLPGVRREQARVTAVRGMLEISGVREMRLSQSDDGRHQLRHREVWHGEFRRTLPLPADSEVEELQAQMNDGVLEIRVPRRAPVGGGRTVPVG
jgi:HSP20 family protein